MVLKSISNKPIYFHRANSVKTTNPSLLSLICFSLFSYDATIQLLRVYKNVSKRIFDKNYKLFTSGQ